MSLGYGSFFVGTLGVALIAVSAIILLPNKKRIPNYLTIVIAILSLVAGAFFIFQAARMLASV